MKSPYVLAKNEKGDEILLGPYSSPAEAQKVADRRDYGDPVVLWLPTRSNAKATGMYKLQKVDAGENIEEAMSRIGHPKEEKV